MSRHKQINHREIGMFLTLPSPTLSLSERNALQQS